MNDTTITLRGNVGSDISTTKTASGHFAIRFRLAVNQWFVSNDGVLTEGRTRWYTIRAWDRLAENAIRSIIKGEPVIVVGRSTLDQWVDRGGKQHVELVVTAQSIGHDLTLGRSTFTKVRRPSGQESSDQWSTPPNGVEQAPDAEGGDPAPSSDTDETAPQEGTEAAPIAVPAVYSGLEVVSDEEGVQSPHQAPVAQERDEDPLVSESNDEGDAAAAALTQPRPLAFAY